MYLMQRKVLQLGILFLFITIFFTSLSAQIDNTGCIGGKWGVDAGLYSGTIEYGDGSPADTTATGSRDWFDGTSGSGIIEEAHTATLTTLLTSGGNPTYKERMTSGLSSITNGQILIDGIFARDYFGGTGHIDISSFETASKNGEDPAIWDIGQSNVLGKNDIIDVAGHMFRDGTDLTSDLWFVGLINRAEPGGSAYMDFEFFVEDVAVNAMPVPGDAGEGTFTSGGPDLGHTAFEFDAGGNITSVGDFIFNTSLINGGIEADVEMRLWVSRDDYNTITPMNFDWGTEFDGPFTGSPYGYASIVPKSGNEACGYVNLENENPSAPPWGTLNTKGHIYQTTYSDYSIVEVGVNMTSFGIDHASLLGADPCEFPINTFMVKTRASASFTAQLKDFAGPYTWGQPRVGAITLVTPEISCETPIITIYSDSDRDDIIYQWSTIDGNIIGTTTADSINVDKSGTYTLTATLPTGCDVQESKLSITINAISPPYQTPTATTTVSCTGSDGTIDLTVSGATPPYTYQWYKVPDGSTVIATDEDPTGLAPGDYWVLVSDNFTTPCTIMSDTFTVASETPVTYMVDSTDVDCNGSNTGSIDLTATGNPTITYQWSNGAITEDLTNLKAGTFTVTTTDGDGCEETRSVTITEPAMLTCSISNIQAVTTIGGSDGQFDLTISGGTINYAYDVLDAGSMSVSAGSITTDGGMSTITGLSYGVYSIAITDANGCTTTCAAFIYEPEICNDGIDNDGDGLSDCFDADCIPTTPGTITASTNPVCVGDTGVTYSIADTGADSYTWTVPTGATITAGQGTISITVNWVSNDGGQVCVIAVTDGCESASNCFDVTLNDVPSVPGSIILQGN